MNESYAFNRKGGKNNQSSKNVRRPAKGPKMWIVIVDGEQNKTPRLNKKRWPTASAGENFYRGWPITRGSRGSACCPRNTIHIEPRGSNSFRIWASGE
jgi:hypothetical protein